MAYKSLEERYQEYKKNNQGSTVQATNNVQASQPASSLDDRYRQWEVNQGYSDTRSYQHERDVKAFDFDSDWDIASKALKDADKLLKAGSGTKYQSNVDFGSRKQTIYSAQNAVSRLRKKFDAYEGVYGTSPEVTQNKKHLDALDAAFKDISKALDEQQTYWGQFPTEKVYNQNIYSQELKGKSKTEIQQMIEGQRIKPQPTGTPKDQGKQNPMMEMGLPKQQPSTFEQMYGMNKTQIPAPSADTGLKGRLDRQKVDEMLRVPKVLRPVDEIRRDYESSIYKSPNADELTEKGQFFQQHYRNTFTQGMDDAITQYSTEKADLEKQLLAMEKQTRNPDYSKIPSAIGDPAKYREYIANKSAQEGQMDKLRGEIARLDSTIKATESNKQIYLTYEKYDDEVFSKPDFAEKSKPVGDLAFNKDKLLNVHDSAYAYINNPKYRDDIKTWMLGLGNTSAPGESLMGYDLMTDNEKGIYNYIYNTQGGEQATAYLKEIGTVLLGRRAEQKAEDYAKFQKENPGIASFITVGAKLYEAASAPSQLVMSLAGMDKNDPLFDVNRFISIVRKEEGLALANTGLMKGLEKILKVNPGEFLYGTAMSIADFGVAAGLGGHSALSQMIMSSSAASEALKAGMDRGLTGIALVTSAVAAGGIEWLTEKYSLDAIFNTANRANIVKYIAQNMLTEASEEAASNFANALLDVIVNGDQSEMQQQYYQLMREEGLSPQKARSMVLIAQAESMGLDALAGALSGGVLSGATGVVDAQAMRNLGGRIITNENEQTLYDLGMTMPQDSASFKLANRLDPANPKKSLTGRLYREIMMDIGDQHQKAVSDHIAASINTRLKEMGETGDTFALAQALATIYGTGNASLQQKQLIANSQHGRDLLMELIATEKGYEIKEQAEEANADYTAKINALDQMTDQKGVKVQAPAKPLPNEPKDLMIRPEDRNTPDRPIDSRSYTDIAREYGKAGLKLEDVERIIGTENMGDDVRAAYERGRERELKVSAERARQIREKGPQLGRVGTLRSISEDDAQLYGVERVGSMSKKVRAAATALRGVAQDTGVNIVLFESPINNKGEHVGKKGWYDRTTATVYLDVKSGYGNEEAIIQTAAHELAHFIQQYAPDYYQNGYRQAVIDTLYEGDATRLQRLVYEEIRIAKANGKTLTESGAMREVIAVASERMLFGDKETLTGLVNANPKLFTRVKGWVDNFVSSLQRAHHALSADTEAAKVMEATYERFKKVQQNYWEALQEASVNLRGENDMGGGASAFDVAHQRAVDAKNRKIGTALSIPREPVDMSQYAPKQEPIIPSIPAVDAVEETADLEVQQDVPQNQSPELPQQEAPSDDFSFEIAPQQEQQPVPDKLSAARTGAANRILKNAGKDNRLNKGFFSGGRQVITDGYRLMVLDRYVDVPMHERENQPVSDESLNNILNPKNGVREPVTLPSIRELEDYIRKRKAYNRDTLPKGVKGQMEYIFPDIDYAVNAEYLLDMMKAFPDVQAYRLGSENTSALLLEHADGLGLLMPIRVGTEPSDYADARKSIREKVYGEPQEEAAEPDEPAPAADPMSKLKGYPRKLQNLVKKWIHNEWTQGRVTPDAFVEFALKWYNYGREGVLPTVAPANNIDRSAKHATFDDTDNALPPFLQTTFYDQGKADAKASADKAAQHAKEQTERGTENEREDTGTGSQQEVPGELPAKGEADQRASVEADGAGPEAGSVLEGVPPEDVQPAGGREQAAPAPAEASADVGRDDDGPAESRDAGTRSLGDTEPRDIQSEAGTEDGRGEAAGPAEQRIDEATEAVQDAIEQAAEERASGNNYIIPAEGLNLPNGKKARFKANVAAIRVVQALEAEGRSATPEEQAILAQYVGWGGIAEAFDERSSVQADWGNEYKELKELLGEDDYARARASTTNAHYTEIGIIRAMYAALQKWGFKGGRVLEPSSGVGNFIGAMPGMGRHTNWTAVELDPTTSLIAKYLYPQAHVYNEGFEATTIPDNYFDLAIGNVPFADVRVVDKKYPHALKKNLHNYFFVKAVDKVRPGGMLMFITSRFSMDSQDRTFREYMATKADLVAAVRLPETAFQQNAATKVVTDILVFKKRAPGTAYSGQDFTGVSSQEFKDPSDTRGNRGMWQTVNDYFIQHPEMVLGEGVLAHSMYSYGLTYKDNSDTPLAKRIEQALSGVEESFAYPEQKTAEQVRDEQRKTAQASKRTKHNGIEIKNGKVYHNEGGYLQEADPASYSADDVVAIQQMLNIRDIRTDLINAQVMGQDKRTVDALRKKLNTAYDAFVKKYGFINDPANIKRLSEDPDKYALFALEEYTPKQRGRNGKPATATKADIFTKDTVAKVERATSAKDPSEAAIISINETGMLDAERIGVLLGMTAAKAREELLAQGIAFKDRNGDLVHAPVYLTGKVRAKLDEARALAKVDKSYQANVQALERVIPKDVPFNDISINIGAPWLPTAVYEQFINHILGLSYRSGLSVERMPVLNTYSINVDKSALFRARVANTSEWGAGGKTFIDLLEKILNSRSMKITRTYRDGDKKVTVVDKKATAAATAKAEEIKEAFTKWLADNPAMTKELERLYNDKYNDQIEPAVDGDALTIDGLNPTIKLNPHQRNVIQRAVAFGGNLLIAHGVGAGKTAEMAGIAMKLKQLGILRKPMFVVPKSVVAQWGKEFLKFFPAAKLLVPSEGDYGNANRKKLVNRIASNEYDAVILSKEMFEAIPLSNSFMSAFYQDQVDEMMEALQDARLNAKEESGRGKGSFTVKELENAIAKLQAHIATLDDKNKRDYDVVEFESLGVDGLFVDEAHNYKTLRVITNLQNVAGINTNKDSGLAFDMLAKVRYMQKMNEGRGVFFATATPVMNTMGELYNMQKYLDPETMKAKGIYSFDGWVKQFGRVTNELQLNASGSGYDIKAILSRFTNMPEMQSMLRSFADVMPVVPGLAVPKVKGGKPIINEIEPTQFQLDYMQQLADRAAALKGQRNVKGGDNMLVVTTDGRDMSLSQRMIDPSLPIETDGKIAAAANNVYDIWRKTADNKGVQLIFLDRGVPGKDGRADMYAEIKNALVKKGIPAAEIANIYDFPKDRQKMELFERVNNGDVRVLMGSTAKLGTGVNVQRRAAAAHHVDVPWRPGDLTQRDGRVIRQGNMYEQLGGVEIHYYVTKRTFDTYMWQKIEIKSRFINQVLDGTNTQRESEGEGIELTAAEVMAIASDNPLVLKKFALENELEKLRAQRGQYDIDQKRYRSEVGRLERETENAKRALPKIDRDITKRVPTKDKAFVATVYGQKYTDRTKAGDALINGYMRAIPDVQTNIGSIGGFTLYALPNNYLLIGSERPVQVQFNPSSGSGAIQRLENALDRFEADRAEMAARIEKNEADVAHYQELMDRPFEWQTLLNEKQADYDELMAMLAPSTEESGDMVDDSELASEDASEEDVDFSFRDPARLSARAALTQALETITETDADKNIIARYKAQLGKVEADVNALRETNAEIRELSFAPGKRDMDKLTRLKNNKETLMKRITRADAALTRIENAAPMKQLIVYEQRKAERALKDLERRMEQRRRTEVKAAQDKGREKMQAYKQGVRDRGFRADIQDWAREMMDWINNPSKDHSVPQVLRRVLGDYLLSLNLQSQRSLAGGAATKADNDLYQRLNDLRDTLSRIKQYQNADETVAGAYAELKGYMDLPSGFLEALADMVKTIGARIDTQGGDMVLNRMSEGELEQLHTLMKILRKAVLTMNKTLAVTDYSNVRDIAQDTVDELSPIVKENKKNGRVSRFFNWDNSVPVYAFDRFGKGGRAIFKALQKGHDAMAKLSRKVADFAHATFTPEESRSWSNTIRTIKMDDGTTMQLSDWHIMSLYAMNRRPQGQGHLYGEGIRVGNFTNKGRQYRDTGHLLTPAKVEEITSLLSDRQRAVAEKLQEYMSTEGRRLGNQVSMIRFGVELFGEEYYFPLESDKAHLPATPDEQMSNGLYRLLNLGMTKQLQKGANNRVMLYSMADVFASHMSDMVQYNTIALPALDAVKWVNYNSSEIDEETGQKNTIGTRDVIRNAFGDSAVSYVTKLLRDINGTRMMGDENEYAMTRLRTFNRAQVAANLRVAFLQPLSIIRAGMHLSAGDILSGSLKNVKGLQASFAEMEKYSGIAIWKQLGFFDTNLSRSLQSIIKQDDKLLDRMTEKSMWLPQSMDRIAWGAIWQAAKHRVNKTNPALERGSEAYFEAVNDVFMDTIYRTQVVDTMLTRSDYMRNQSFLHKWTSSFMSEPTLSYNMLMGMAHNYSDDIAKGMSKQAAWQKHGKTIARGLTVFGASAIVLTMMEALMEAWRDEDEFATFGQKFIAGVWDNALDNLFPLNLPLISDIWEQSKRLLANITGWKLRSFDDTNVITAFGTYLVEGIDTLVKHATGKGDSASQTVYGGAFKVLQGASMLTGIPMASAVREAVSLWNNTAGHYAPSMIIRRYEGGLKKGYQSLYEAIEDANTGREAQLRELLELRGADDKQVYGGLRDQVKAAMLEERITEQEAIDLLSNEKGNPGATDVYWSAQSWKAKAENPDASFARTNRLKQAIIANKDVAGAMQELEQNGYENKDVLEEIRTIVGKLYRAGEMSRQTAEQRIKTYAPYEKPSDIYKQLQRWDYTKQTGTDVGYSVYDRFYEAVNTGKELKAVIAEYLDPNKYGYDRDTLAAEITRHFRPIYVELYKKSRREASKLQGYLLNAYVALGYKRSNRIKSINAWLDYK